MAGAVLFANDHSAALVCDPDLREIVEPMLAWAEARYGEIGAAGKPLGIEAMASNAFLEQLTEIPRLCQTRGALYPSPEATGRRSGEPVTLPDGFYVNR